MDYCICGYSTDKKGLIGNHKKVCKVHKDEKDKILSNRQLIVDLYLDTYSVSKVLNKLQTTKIVSRGHIEKILKEEGVYEGLNGENYLKKKVENNKKIMLEKYGVINISQHPTLGGGFQKKNKIPYEKISFFSEDYIKYCKEVDKLTQKNIRKRYKRKEDLPKYCEYTDVMFMDVMTTPNPNDPLKRTVDHRQSKSNCYLLGKSVEECSSLDNISFCLRLVNTLKQNQNIDHFEPMLVKIKEVLRNEGCKSRED